MRTMYRIFHEKVGGGMIFFLSLMILLTFFWGWQKNVLALFCLLVSILCIERVLHATYTVTAEGELIVHRGRFGGGFRLYLADIQRIEQHYAFHLGVKWGSYLLIVTRDGKERSVWPVKEQDFVEYIEKQRKVNNEQE